MIAVVLPGALRGAVQAPPSKSAAHRAMICAALADGVSAVFPFAPSGDVSATRAALQGMGARFFDEAGGLRVEGVGGRGAFLDADCAESGSTLRFLTALCAAVCGGGRFTGHGRLMERPMEPYLAALSRHGARAWREGGALCLTGALSPGEYELPGDVSSQFVSGLLFALPLLSGDSVIRLVGRVESRGYIDMTLEALSAFGVSARWAGEARLSVPGGQRYAPARVCVEGDWSAAAYWLCFGARVDGLRADSRQPDAKVKRLMREAGDIDVSGCPDLLPPLCALAATRAGETRFVGARRLRLKESDRLESVASALTALGAEATAGEDSLVVRGRERLPGGAEADCAGDHRVAMMLAVAATRCERSVRIVGAECVGKSYPRFFEDFAALGGRVTLGNGA